MRIASVVFDVVRICVCIAIGGMISKYLALAAFTAIAIVLHVIFQPTASAPTSHNPHWEDIAR